MTTIQIMIHGDKFEVEVKGHAGFAKAGEDIVCAAVSCLIQTFMYHLDKITNTYQCTVHEAYVRITGSGKIARECCEMLLTGFELLEENYPEYIGVHS